MPVSAEMDQGGAESLTPLRSWAISIRILSWEFVKNAHFCPHGGHAESESVC